MGHILAVVMVLLHIAMSTVRDGRLISMTAPRHLTQDLHVLQVALPVLLASKVCTLTIQC